MYITILKTNLTSSIISELFNLLQDDIEEKQEKNTIFLLKIKKNSEDKTIKIINEIDPNNYLINFL